MTAGEAVAAAAKALDRLSPGWAQLVSPERLYLSSMSYCILGQMNALGYFTDELYKLQMKDPTFSQHEFAFNIGYCNPFDRIDLQAAWVAELEARRGEAPDFVPDEWRQRGRNTPEDRPALMSGSSSGR